MASLNICVVFKFLFFALLFIAFSVSATNTPFIHKPPNRKMGMEYKNVAKAKKPASVDTPWGGGYVPPILNNN